MGTFKPGEIVQRFLGQPPMIEPDRVLDDRIRQALLEEVVVRPSSGAWERLRQAIIERKCKNYGMWVLDEPQRDPPESPPMLLNGSQYERARRIYDVQGGIGGVRELPLYYKNTVWGSMLPPFSALLNW